jgi:hypothetical protein
MSDYLDQVRHQIDQTRQALKAAEDELAANRQRAARHTAVETALREVLATFVHKVHPGRPCLQSQMINVETVQKWRETLAQLTTPKPSSGQRPDVSSITDNQLGGQLKDAEAERDAAYRERAELVAWLAAIHPAVLAPAPDIDEPGWQIIYLHADGQQLSWHIHPRDAELFRHVDQIPADDPRAQWDGHTTVEKYERIHALAAAKADPRCCVCGTTEHPRDQSAGA